jgi:tellurite resistance protein
MAKHKWDYFLSDEYSFLISVDDDGRKTGKLVDLKTNKVLADDLIRKVIPENIPNLLNVARVVVSAAWQDGKILQEEKDAFNTAFAKVDFTEEQRDILLKEFENPTPIDEYIHEITSRDHKMLILETCILLVIADGEFHPKEKEFIDKLVKEFKLAPEDFALLYRILPERAKKYIVKEKLHEGLNIKADEIAVLDKFVPDHKVEDLKHDHVYRNLMSNWRNRRTRYSRIKSY